MQATKRFLSLVIIILAVNAAGFGTAAATSFPKGCEASGFQYDGLELVLNEEGKQTLYFIKNNDRQGITLKYREDKAVFMSAGWQTDVSPRRWAAFAADEKNMHFQCIARGRHQQEQVDCKQVLELCQYPRVKFAGSNMGNYWVSENKSLRQTMRAAIKKGILLRW